MCASCVVQAPALKHFGLDLAQVTRAAGDTFVCVCACVCVCVCTLLPGVKDGCVL